VEASAFWDQQLTAYDLKVGQAKAATVARHTEERRELTQRVTSAPVKQGLPYTARHFIDTHFEPSPLIETNGVL